MIFIINNKYNNEPMPKKTGQMADSADVHSLTIKTISEIVNLLIAAYDRGERIDLSKLKVKVAA